MLIFRRDGVIVNYMHLLVILLENNFLNYYFLFLDMNLCKFHAIILILRLGKIDCQLQAVPYTPPLVYALLDYDAQIES